MTRWGVVAAIAFLGAVETAGQAGKPYTYTRAGAAQDLVVTPQSGFALMGGGADLDAAFGWMCERAHGGDFLILRASGDDAYNEYVQKLCKLNSVATLIVPTREAANAPPVAEAIAHAEAIFIAGGDQANYIRNWTGTPVQAQINAAIERGVPVGGTSAGLAVLGEWAYSAEGDKADDSNLDGKMALADPYGPRVTLAHRFLDIPILRGIITDSHFAKRDRMGRLLAFVARLNQEQGGQTTANFAIRGIGIDEGAAVLLEKDGKGIVIGRGSAYLVQEELAPTAIDVHKPLGGIRFGVLRVLPNRRLNVADWTGDGTAYKLRVRDAGIASSQMGNAVY